MPRLVAYLVLLYGLWFLLISPERVAPPLTLGLTVGLHLAVLLLVRGAGRDAPPVDDGDAPLVGRRELDRGLVLLTGLGVVVAVGLPVATPFVVLAYLALVVAGPALFLWAVLRVARVRRAARPPG